VIPWFQFTSVQVGPLTIQVWGFFVALGIAISLPVLSKVARKQGVNPEHMLDHALWIVIIGLIGARLFHILFYRPEFFLSNPVEIIKVWHGGMSSYGGFFGAFVGFWLFAKKKKLSKKQWLKRGDLVAYSSVIGWLIARVGCFMIHDHIGKICPHCLFTIKTADGDRLEMALVEIVALLPLALFLYIQGFKKRVSDGWYLAVVLMYYGVVRFVLDFFRAQDIAQADTRYLGLTPAQYFSMVAVVLGLFLFKKVQTKHGEVA